MARRIRQVLLPLHFTHLQVLKLALLALGMWMLGHYVLEVWEYMGVRAEEAAWREAVAREEARHAAYQERLEFVRTDAYVEEEAREGLRWVKRGEHAVRPLLEERAVQVGNMAGAGGGRPTWQQWRDRFFGP